VVECGSLVRQILDKGEKRWKTSVQLFRRHEKIVNEFVMPYRMQGLRPVSSHNHSGSIGVLKRTPELDEVVRAIVAADKRLTRLN
jgi:hypothetical protein